MIANGKNTLAASPVDMTDMERQSLGGFRVAQPQRRKEDRS